MRPCRRPPTTPSAARGWEVGEGGGFPAGRCQGSLSSPAAGPAMLPGALAWQCGSSARLLSWPAPPGPANRGKSFLIENLLRSPPPAPLPLKLGRPASAQQRSAPGGACPGRHWPAPPLNSSPADSSSAPAPAQATSHEAAAAAATGEQPAGPPCPSAAALTLSAPAPGPAPKRNLRALPPSPNTARPRRRPVSWCCASLLAPTRLWPARGQLRPNRRRGAKGDAGVALSSAARPCFTLRRRSGWPLSPGSGGRSAYCPGVQGKEAEGPAQRKVGASLVEEKCGPNGGFRVVGGNGGGHEACLLAVQTGCFPDGDSSNLWNCPLPTVPRWK